MASALRPLISYDDITVPYQTASPPPRSNARSNQPPAKKRKWSKKPKGRPHDDSQSFHNHQNFSGHSSRHASGGTAMGVAEDKAMEEEEESRDLTHDEIWDDSALIDAWNAAAEEYEALNGPKKGWKAEPVHKSPLWYNTPKSKNKDPAPTTSSSSIGGISVPDVDDQDSQPLNFDTFVPSHDPSLDVPVPIQDGSAAQFLTGPPGPIVSQDEAFTRAMGAMYWSGYWTAMYHCQRRQAQEPSAQYGGAAEQGEEETYEEDADLDDDDGEEDGEEEVFVSTQR
ncbi:hypothetical protein DXG03_001996 [Asterophora parasitica]|uniref:Uncharacterized protein n=1 Tax=Asterophora parasitica TaxID=117018 RepID=A0A9P7KFJ2_9AGAR|nr:hypothetical protein DXG03_001996 [Asterophora parasitica]